MEKTYLSDIADYEDKEATFNGWVYNIRSVGKVWFLILRDGTGMTQCVVNRGDTTNDIFDLEKSLTQESSVSVRGFVKKHKSTFDMLADEFIKKIKNFEK